MTQCELTLLGDSSLFPGVPAAGHSWGGHCILMVHLLLRCLQSTVNEVRSPCRIFNGDEFKRLSCALLSPNSSLCGTLWLLDLGCSVPVPPGCQPFWSQHLLGPWEGPHDPRSKPDVSLAPRTHLQASPKARISLLSPVIYWPA